MMLDLSFQFPNTALFTLDGRTLPLRKGQSAKVNETFSENLTKSTISPLNFPKWKQDHGVFAMIICLVWSHEKIRRLFEPPAYHSHIQAIHWPGRASDSDEYPFPDQNLSAGDSVKRHFAS